MKAVATIAILVVCLFGGALFSTVVTVGAWHIQIEPRAFQCWDDVGIFNTYWEDIDEHRGTDKISPGWTWDQIRRARQIYIGAFFAIWAASSLIPFRLIMTRGAANKTLHATAAAPGS